MRKLAALFSLMGILILLISCTPAEKPADTNSDPEVQVEAEPATIPSEGTTGTPVDSPEIVPGTVPEMPSGDGITTTMISDQELRTFLKAVITNDVEAVKGLVTGEAAKDIDKLIADIGYRDFLVDDDYDALWAKAEAASRFSMTGMSPEMSAGIWELHTEDGSLPDINVLFEMMMEDGVMKVTMYTVNTQG